MLETKICKMVVIRQVAQKHKKFDFDWINIIVQSTMS